MAWNVSVNEVINRWVGEAPDEDDVLLTTLVSDAVILIKRKVKNIDERLIKLNPENPLELNEPDLQTLLNMTIATMVQRAYYSDYTTYSNVSNTVGAQSASYSKSSTSKQGLYITDGELSLISGEVETESRFTVVKAKITPNFYPHPYLNGGGYYGYW